MFVIYYVYDVHICVCDILRIYEVQICVCDILRIRGTDLCFVYMYIEDTV